MALLLLLFGGLWAHMVSMTSTPEGASPSVSDNSEAYNLSLVISPRMVTKDPKETVSNWSQILTPSSPGPLEASTVGPLALPTGASTGPQALGSATPSVLSETSSATSDPAVPIAVNSLGHPTMTPGTTALRSLETSNGTSGPPVTMATSSPVPSNDTSEPPVTMATSSLASSETSRPVTMATSSLASSNETSRPPVTMATSSPAPSNETSGPLVVMATSTPAPPSETSGPPVTTTTSSLEPSSVVSGSPVSSVKISVMSTPKPSTNTSPSNPDQRSNGTLLVPVMVTLLVVTILVVLLLLWRRRQKRRTGVLMLSRGGKRNGVVDAWAGPAQVPDEEVTTVMVGASGGDKGSSVPATEGSGQRPTLTTFFSRRKSRQGSLALEELKSGSGPSLKGEEEPLVGSEDEAAEAPASCGPEAGDGDVPQGCE